MHSFIYLLLVLFDILFIYILILFGWCLDLWVLIVVVIIPGWVITIIILKFTPTALGLCSTRVYSCLSFERLYFTNIACEIIYFNNKYTTKYTLLVSQGGNKWMKLCNHLNACNSPILSWYYCYYNRRDAMFTRQRNILNRVFFHTECSININLI